MIRITDWLKVLSYQISLLQSPAIGWSNVPSRQRIYRWVDRSELSSQALRQPPHRSPMHRQRQWTTQRHYQHDRWQLSGIYNDWRNSDRPSRRYPKWMYFWIRYRQIIRIKSIAFCRRTGKLASSNKHRLFILLYIRLGRIDQCLASRRLPRAFLNMKNS